MKARSHGRAFIVSSANGCHRLTRIPDQLRAISTKQVNGRILAKIRNVFAGNRRLRWESVSSLRIGVFAENRRIRWESASVAVLPKPVEAGTRSAHRMLAKRTPGDEVGFV